MGLLDGLTGTDWNDPKTAATFQLAAGLLGPGGFGTGLSRGLAGYQGTMGADAETKLKKAQTTDIASQVVLRNLQAQQQQRMFDLQTPFLEEAVRRMQAPMSQAQAPGVAPGVPQAPQGSVPQAQSVSQPQSQPGGSMFPGVPDSVAFATIGTGGFAKLPELIGKYNEPTDLLKMLASAGIDPSSPLGKQFIQAHLAKQNYQAPLNARPGSIIRDPYDPSKVVAVNPTIPTGGTPSFDASGNVTSMSPIPGAFGVMGSGAAAKTAGEGSVLPYAGVDASGKPLPVTNRTAVATQGSRQSPEAELQAIRSALPLMADELKNTPEGPARAALMREMGRYQNALLTKQPFTASTTASPTFAEAPPGTKTNAQNNANEISKKWTAQLEAHQQAQTTNSYLDSIEQMSKTAQAGPFSDRIALANALLAPFSDKRADALTAKQLLDKYSNQIVARLGQGGLGTDAARNIIAGAYPNSSMLPSAIAEAAANLRGANNMTQARTTLLQPIAADRTPAANASYDAAATKFDTLADPRLFQLKNMSPEQAQKYISAMPKNVQDDLRARAAKLKEMGVF